MDFRSLRSKTQNSNIHPQTSTMLGRALAKGFNFCTHAAKDTKFLARALKDHHDLVFIRHAESLFNQACEQYRIAHRIPYVWKELCNHEGFDQTVLYNTAYMDCPLTERGRKECRKTRKMLENVEIDCVIVSPQLRALQTCQSIFEGRKLPVFVEPILTGPLRSCSDVNMPLHVKKVLFQDYNFNPTQNMPFLWFLDYLPKEMRELCQQSFKDKEITDDMQKRFQIVELLRQKKIHEDAYQYRRRIQRVKNLLADYREHYGRIAVVTHYYTIEYLSAMEYMDNGVPKYYMDIKNCLPYYANLKDLLSVKEPEPIS